IDCFVLQSAKKYFNSHEYLQQGIFQQVKENVRVEARKKDNDTGQTHLRNLEFLPIVVDLVQWSIPCSNTEDQRVWLNCHEDKNCLPGRHLAPGVLAIPDEVDEEVDDSTPWIESPHDMPRLPKPRSDACIVVFFHEFADPITLLEPHVNPASDDMKDEPPALPNIRAIAQTLPVVASESLTSTSDQHCGDALLHAAGGGVISDLISPTAPWTQLIQGMPDAETGPCPEAPSQPMPSLGSTTEVMFGRCLDMEMLLMRTSKALNSLPCADA
ncbi:unnamed protein product, partial [Cladocopium goreaui]